MAKTVAKDLLGLWLSDISHIQKDKHYKIAWSQDKTLFFPLSIGSGDGSIASGEVEVGGEVLTPGTFVQFDQTTTIDAQLDCLVVYLPER